MKKMTAAFLALAAVASLPLQARGMDDTGQEYLFDVRGGSAAAALSGVNNVLPGAAGLLNGYCPPFPVEYNVFGQPLPREIRITATDGALSPPEFTVKPGQRVDVLLVNDGSASHSIAISLPGGLVTLPRCLAYGESGGLQFVAPGPGIYPFFCPVDAHGARGMRGKMVVQ
ncbi:MAG: cupredoxin domain-containing protein [Endomicrobiales bacterium]